MVNEVIVEEEDEATELDEIVETGRLVVFLVTSSVRKMVTTSAALTGVRDVVTRSLLLLLLLPVWLLLL